MKRTLLVTLVGALVIVGAAGAASIVTSSHDLSAALTTSQQVCVFCHTPHQAGTTQDPLWNHTLTTNATYGIYGSLTLNATPVEIGGTSSASLLCMSCHDATVGLGSLYNDPNITGGAEETPSNSATLISGNANVGTDLTNDHPVNFTYDTALMNEDGGLNDPTGAPINGWLNGGTLECSSCHDVHDPQFIPFLRIANTDSDLCTACHTK